jgi:peptide/nickel transport system permease protein
MLKYVSVRLLAVLPVVALVVVIVFLLLHLSPGDPAALVAGENASPEQVELIRQRLHLDEPILTQFWLWVRNLVFLDLGNSIFSNQPVTRLIAQRIEPTMMLAMTTTLLTVAFAVPAGVIAAWKNNTPADRGVMVMSVAGFSVPVFVLGYALMYVFSIKLHWLPVQGYKPLAAGFWACLRSLVLPSVALALVFSALVARVTRAAMLDILSEDYIRTAAAKGARTPRVLLMHALKNAGVPIMTVIGIGFAGLIGGVVVTESVFNIPGIGRLTVDAIAHRDYPVVQGVILAFSAVLIGINLLVDLSYSLFDPRIRY